MWHKIPTAPFDRDLELAVIDENGVVHAIAFPCRRILGGWIRAQTMRQIDLRPTHWREWGSGPLRVTQSEQEAAARPRDR